MASMADTMPELVLVAETDAAAARRARRLAVQGTLRRLYPSVYTSNLDTPPEAIVLRHWQAIVGHLLPDGVISHRSAFDSRPHAGSSVHHSRQDTPRLAIAGTDRPHRARARPPT